jgi:hypothetical protein
MRKWSERQQKNAPEDDEECPDDILDYPLLIIVWNPLGLAHRAAINAAHTKASLVAGLSFYFIFTIVFCCPPHPLIHKFIVVIDGDPSATIERDDAGNSLDECGLSLG